MEKRNDQLSSTFEVLADSIREVPVPDRINDCILRGISRAQAERNTKQIPKIWFGSAAAMMILVLIFTTFVRVSPAFAAIVSEIPGMHYIVKLIGGDKGLVTAVNNDLFQPIEESDTHDDITVTVDGIIADETRMNIFYTIRFPEQNGDVELRQIGVRLPDGTMLDSGFSWWFQPSDGIIAGEHSNFITINFDDSVAIPDSFILETRVERNGTVLKPVWSVPISINNEQFLAQKITFQIGKTVNIEGQRIAFVSATVHPTQIAVEIEFDPKNTKKIFSFVDLSLIGDHGEKYPMSGSHQKVNKQIIYFQGSSFSMPESLMLTGSKLRALDRDRLEIVVDTEEEKLLKAPDERMKLGSIAKEGGGISLNFLLSGIPKDDNNLYSLPEGNFKDGSGATFDFGGSGGMSINGDKNSQMHTFRIPDADYVQPLTFTAASYPSYIVGDFKVKLK